MDIPSDCMSCGIVIEKTTAFLCNKYCGDPEQNFEVHKGTMIEIRSLNVNQTYCEVRIHDYHQRNLAFEHNLYMIKQNALIHVSEMMWPLLAAISDPIERANIAKDSAFCDYISTLRENSFVTINGQYFSKCLIRESLQFLPEREPKDRSLDYNCIIRYIGPVEEIGPGYFFGLELLVN